MCVESFVSFSDEPESFLQTLGLFSLVLEPVAIHLVHELTLMQGLISIADSQIRHMLVEVGNLRDLGGLHHVCEVGYFCSNSIIVVSQLVSSHLEVLYLFTNAIKVNNL